jgi:hypothetical protein
VMVGACAALVFLGGHFLTCRRSRRAALLYRAERMRPSRFLKQESTMVRRFQRSLRRAPVAVLVSDAAATVAPVRGWVIHRPAEGLVLELEKHGQVDAETVLNVRPAGADEHVPWVPVQVKECQAEARCWHLDCRYVRVPPYSVRVLFG